MYVLLTDCGDLSITDTDDYFDQALWSIINICYILSHTCCYICCNIILPIFVSKMEQHTSLFNVCFNDVVPSVSTICATSIHFIDLIF